MQIKRVNSQQISPIVWYSIPIYQKELLIRGILEDLEKDELKDFLLPVKEEDGDFIWQSSKKLKEFEKFNSFQKSKILEKVKTKTQKILEIAKKLQNSEEETKKELGELLTLAIEFPDLSFVFADEKTLEPSITGWGFRWRDGKSTSGRILQQIEEEEKEIKQASTKDQTLESLPKEEIKKSTKKKINFALILLGTLLLLSFGVIWYLLNNLAPTPSNLTQQEPISHQISKEFTPKYKPIPKSKIKIDENLPGKPKVITNRVIVILKDDANPTTFRDALQSISGVKEIFANDIIKTLELEIDSKDKIQKIKALPGVKSVELEKVLSTNFIPQDPLFRMENASWEFKAINGFEAWDITKGSPKTVIAVIDGSFDLNHPELKDKTIVMPYNASLGIKKIIGVKNDEGYLHGTHVSSLALGEIGNFQGTGGLCPECAFMPIELATKEGVGYTSMAKIRGILWAIEHGADVINLSLGINYNIDFASLSFEEKKALEKEIKKATKTEKVIYDRLYEYAKSKGVILVYAAGNENMFADIDPAKEGDSGRVLVAAVDKDLKKASFSNFGKNVDISAPGVDIVSAAPNGNYKALSGTSMASPIVAGIVGLIKTICPKIELEELKNVLKNASKSVSYPSGEVIGGLIDAKKALSLAKDLKICGGNSSSLTQQNPTTPNPTAQKKDFNKVGQSMKMPKKAQGMRFSYGLWKSDTPLYNESNKSVEVFYYLSPEGSYREIVEPNDRCKGVAYPKLKGRILYIKCEEANCQNKINVAYSPTNVICKPNKDDIVICKSQSNTATASFKLIKVR